MNAMITVFFSSEMQRVTGEEKVNLAVYSYRQLVAALVDKYRFKQEELMAMAVAIDGMIIHDPLLESIADGSEVHFLHRISGG